MSFNSEFTQVALADLHHEAAVMKTDGWRFMQTHAVNTDDGVDLYYSFMKKGSVKNLKVKGVTKDDVVPSITDLFLAAFVFENEARELFGVDMRDIAIDFAGAMYAPAESEPMRFITPEQKAAREKARKAQEAKAAKPAAPAADDAAKEPAGKAHVFVMTPERRKRLDAKLATMSPEKVAKVEAALKAREAEAQAVAAGDAPQAKKEEKPSAGDDSAKEPTEPKQADAPDEKPALDRELESKISLLDSEKAAKVRAAMEARRGMTATSAADEPDKIAPVVLDAVLESKLATMNPEKASKVRAALAAKAAKSASSKKGE